MFFGFSNSLILGIKKGLSIPTLPPIVEFYYNYPIIRILRFIGGLCSL